MRLLNITQDLTIDVDDIAAMSWDHRHYVNGCESTLIIAMSSGWVQCFKDDAYAIEKKIKKALEIE